MERRPVEADEGTLAILTSKGFRLAPNRLYYVGPNSLVTFYDDGRWELSNAEMNTLQMREYLQSLPDYAGP